MITRRGFSFFVTISALPVSGAYSTGSVEDDSLVYAAYLNDASAEVEGPTGLVIHPQSLAVTSPPGPGWPKTQRDVQALLPGVSASAAADALIQLHSAKPVLLPLGTLSPRLKVVQPLPSDIAEIFQIDGSLAHQWETFRTRFKGFTTLVKFSAVGYSSGLDEAVFVVSSSCGGLCGEGRIVLMRRTSAGWRIIKSEKLWAS